MFLEFLKYADDKDVVTLRGQLKLLPGIAERDNFEARTMNILDIIKSMQSF